MKVLMAVTHLLGTGHLGRALALGRAFVAAGHDAVVVSGGRSAPHLDATGVRVEQLPPVASDGTNFARLLDDAGAEIDDAYRAARIDRLVSVLHAEAPDVLITELFPFGRRVLRHEFDALLQASQAMQPRPLVLSSVRDILAPPSKPDRAAKTETRLTEFYDGVLVHSDPHITPLDQSWPVTPAIAAMLRYTGFVTAHAPTAHPDRAGAGEIIVATGGGAVGDDIFTAAIAAATLRPDWSLRLLVGGGEDRVARFAAQAEAAPNVIVEPVRPDYRQMLCHARASVSMCGYNTAMDLLQTGVPAVIVPFDDGGEVEQSLRAKSLRTAPTIDAIARDELSAERLVKALEQVANAATTRSPDVDLDGAAGTVRIVAQMVDEVCK